MLLNNNEKTLLFMGTSLVTVGVLSVFHYWKQAITYEKKLEEFEETLRKEGGKFNYDEMMRNPGKMFNAVMNVKNEWGRNEERNALNIRIRETLSLFDFEPEEFKHVSGGNVKLLFDWGKTVTVKL